MWTFWYHIPDENEAFIHTNFERIITCDTVDEVEYVLMYFKNYNWLNKGIFAITSDEHSPKIEDNLNCFTISYVSYWEHNQTKENIAQSVFEETIRYFVEGKLLQGAEPICIRSTPKINKRCAFNIWTPTELYVSDIRNIINRQFMSKVNPMLFKFKNDPSPYRLADLKTKHTKCKNQFNILFMNLPTLSEAMESKKKKK